MTDTVTCKICAAPSRHFGNARVLNRYDVSYFRCARCEFVQTEEPYWLEEAYADAINRADVGLVSRNLDLCRKTAAVLLSFFDCDARFLDYGGGYGLFVRLMRDAGFDFYWADKHCANIFARDFAAQAGGNDAYELVTAFELFEHLAHPLEEIDRMLGCSRNILFTTELMPASAPLPGDWWYYIPDYGQHIAFYTLKTLNVIAEKHSLRLCSDGKFFHLLTERPLSPVLFRIVSRKRISALRAALSRRESLISADYRRITGT